MRSPSFIVAGRESRRIGSSCSGSCSSRSSRSVEAIGYAHSRGVIHRDLKPENVVLGGYGEVVVLDWGLAKVVGQPDDDDPKAREPRISVSADAETKATIGQVGTPVYMAPEQVEADNDLIDTRTDVYGLGAILFEILTAHPPATGATVGEVFSKIQAGNLPRARELEPTVPRALEAICARRWHLTGATVTAARKTLPRTFADGSSTSRSSVYRDRFAVRLLRWGRRHRTLATSLARSVLTTVIGLSVGVVLVGAERAAPKPAEDRREQRKIATANATRALHNLRLAQDAADGLLGEVADVDLADIPQMEPVRQRLLEKARAGYQQFLVEEGDDPRIRWGAVRAQVRLGDIQALQGDVPKAELSYRTAAAELEKLASEIRRTPTSAATWRRAYRVWVCCSRMPTASRKAKPSSARRSGCAKRSPSCRMQAPKTCRPWPTAATSWAACSLAAALPLPMTSRPTALRSKSRRGSSKEFTDRPEFRTRWRDFETTSPDSRKLSAIPRNRKRFFVQSSHRCAPRRTV